jgi:arylsulfatase A-like enzyme
MPCLRRRQFDRAVTYARYWAGGVAGLRRGGIAHGHQLQDRHRAVVHEYDDKRIFETPPPNVYPGLREEQFRTLKDVDDLVNQVFTTLQQNGEARNTLAIYISDNGYMWREHGPPVATGSLPQECRTEDTSRPGYFTNSKQDCGPSGKPNPYLETARVPFFMRWGLEGNLVRRNFPDPRLAANIDIAPTVMDAIGQVPKPPMDGKSLLATAPDTRNRLLIEAWSGSSPFASLVTRLDQGSPYQYTEYYKDDGTPLTWPTTEPEVGDQPVREYYDLGADTGELENRLHDNNPSNDPDTASLSGQLSDDRGCSGASCP